MESSIEQVILPINSQIQIIIADASTIHPRTTPSSAVKVYETPGCLSKWLSCEILILLIGISPSMFPFLPLLGNLHILVRLIH